ncbi:hypothetical protein DAEQUDRAFT_693396 [Daedalea quercina L-15889]|uniref:Protein kinase domain-containing protein n=1 Tax=Daedalea quercina L-15889 TaxID=1314783 RepID=A0A165P796_9APHY|nr:hypothetical protein DAEQUDRAFT_693396 [Daedalea quercina L-15889]
MDSRPKPPSEKSTLSPAPEMHRSTPPRTSPLHSSPLAKEVPLPGVPAIDLGDAASEASGQSSPDHLPGSRRRGLSTSTIRPNQSTGSVPVARVASNPLPYGQAATASFSSLVVQGGYPVTRSRSSSTGRGRSISPASRLGESIFTWRVRSRRSETPPNGVPQSWWNDHEVEARPWSEAGKRQKSIPKEQTEGWHRTRKRVAEAVVNVLGVAEDVGHEALVISSELLEFAPLPGLRVAALALLDIWEALQMVDVNRMACLRLTERCATILFSVREEIAEAGDQVGEELIYPIQRLVESFTQVHHFLQKQNHRPFIKRYLKRDEIQRHIAVCDSALTDALGMFSLSIQIRILKQVLQAEQQRQADTAALLDELHGRREQPRALPAAAANKLQLAGAEEPQVADVKAVASIDRFLHANPEQIRETLNTITLRQNEHDLAQDTADLRQLMRDALQANSDVDMIRVLQVGRDEMPEAIKALQRALESEVARENAAADQEDTVLIASISSTAVTHPGAAAGEGANLTRSATIASVESRKTASDRSSSHRRTPKDTLDREFIETGIDALRRLSTAEVSLPSWTITRYEVDREQKIGIGFFSDVYKGTWRDRTVAIKVLADMTPRQLFIHEVNIWKSLAHPNVLELLGASSASSEPPWFFVSPYLKNGSLVSYLKGLPSLDSVDLLKMIHEIAKGMAYLHSKEVLHGDLKGANVLVDDRGHCVISDFGQSEIKSEIYRLSGTPTPHGTLRWQAPELMAGHSGLTQQIDVYAFAICCIEVLTKGALPWPLADDDAVRHFVLKENMRPEIPLVNQKWIPLLTEIMRACWRRDPAGRPPFSKVVTDIQRMRQSVGGDIKDSPRPPHHELPEVRDSPDMHPIPLPPLPPDTTATFIEDNSLSSEASYQTARGTSPMPSEPSYVERVLPSPLSSRHSSMGLSDTDDSHSDSGIMLDPPGYQSPPPIDEHNAELRNERRYRMLLQHEFHPSLSLPLWTPTQVPLGSVGYLSKPEGTFVTLFNAFKPLDSSGGRMNDMASIEGFGRVTIGTQKSDKRNVAQRGMDMIQSWLTSRSNQPPTTVSRRYSSPLRAGHKTAHLFTESTAYRYIDDLGAPKRWFKVNVDAILKEYGDEHRIGREDLFLIIGTLEAQDYALYVGHSHPDGQLNFNVYSSPRAGQPWGHFSTTDDLSSSLVGGPVYDEPEGHQLDVSASKVSTVGRGGKWDAVLLARLRFTTDGAEPTSK